MKRLLFKNSCLRGVLLLFLCIVGIGNVCGELVNFKLHTGDVTDGYYIIVSNGVAMNNQTSSNRLQYDNVTISNNIIQAESNARYVWHITSEGNDTYTIKNANNNYYAVSTGTNNQATTKNGTIDNKYKWYITNNEKSCSIENVHNKKSSINYTIRRNSTYGFACYAASTGTGPILYKKVEAPTKTVTELTISGTASNTTYYVGDTPSAEGLVVKATYDDKTTSDVTDDVIWTFNPEKLTEEGNIEVTATAEYQNKSVSYTYSVIVTQNPKITDYTLLEDGKKYYIGTTLSNGTDYYFSTTYTTITDAVKGVAQTDKTNANILTAIANSSNKTKWAFQFENGYYLSLKDSQDNGMVRIIAQKTYWELSNTTKGLVNMTTNGFCLQRNSSSGTTNFGSYKNTQTDIWFIEVPTYDVEISSAGYATFCLPYNAIVPEGMTAYTATDNGESVKLTAKESNKIAAGEGVILKGKEGTYTFVAAEGNVNATESNQLVGVTKDTQLSASDNAYMLTRDKNTNAIAFRRLATTTPYTLSANKAYLKLNGGDESRQLISVTWDDNATSIYKLKGKKDVHDGAIYNLAGQKLIHTQKGINIINGKLVIK